MPNLAPPATTARNRATRNQRTVRAPVHPAQALDTARRWLRRIIILMALSIPVLAGSWVWHASVTAERVEQIASNGIPRWPSPWTFVRGALQGAPTVALQIGHLHASEHPEELAVLRFSTGGRAGGMNEVDVNTSVALELAQRLRAAGVNVELVGASVPPRYSATVFLSLHADGTDDASRTGYKSAHVEPLRNRRDPWLLTTIDAAYLTASPLAHDEANISSDMLQYYAFSHERFDHTTDARTTGIIVEMGYLTNPHDRAWLSDPSQPADALFEGIMRYLAAVDRWHPALLRLAGPGELDASVLQR